MHGSRPDVTTNSKTGSSKAGHYSTGSTHSKRVPAATCDETDACSLRSTASVNTRMRRLGTSVRTLVGRAGNLIINLCPPPAIDDRPGSTQEWT
jgi:hypothetical protein